jgi:hypothetical protein
MSASCVMDSHPRLGHQDDVLLPIPDQSPLTLFITRTQLTLSETPSLPRCRRTSTPDRDLSNRNPSENKVPEPTTGVHSKKTEPTESKQTTMPLTSKRSSPWKNEMIMSLPSPVESSLMTPSSILLLPMGIWRVVRVSLILLVIV